MMRAILAALILALAEPARAEIVDGARIEVVDGDTLELPCTAPCNRERLRFFGIDSPELSSPRCEGEQALAIAARDRMRALMAGRVEIVRGEPSTGRMRDRYGRTLGTVLRLDAAPGLPAGDVQRDMLARAEQEWGQPVAKIAWKRHKLKEPPGRVRVMTDDERRRLFACLDVRFWPLAKFILATGLRRAEACGLLWSQVDLTAPRITIPVKGGEVVPIPLSEAAAIIIKSQAGAHPTHVFSYETRRLYGGGAGRVVPILPETLYTAFRRARDSRR